MDWLTELSEWTRQKQKNFFPEKQGRTYSIHRKEDFIRKQLELTGYFVILTNDSKDSEYILNIYRTKDVAEKLFNNIRNELDLERLRIHSDKAIEGRMIIGFISLIIFRI